MSCVEITCKIVERLFKQHTRVLVQRAWCVSLVCLGGEEKGDGVNEAHTLAPPSRKLPHAVLCLSGRVSCSHPQTQAAPSGPCLHTHTHIHSFIASSYIKIQFMYLVICPFKERSSVVSKEFYRLVQPSP